MRKLRDLEKKESSDLRDDVAAGGEVLGLDTYEANKGTHLSDDIDIYGICRNCRWFKYVKYEFTSQFATCETFDKQLSGKQRIIECNSFDERGKLTLDQMLDIATIIEVGSKQMGFGT